MEFRIVGRVIDVEVIAAGTAIRKRKRLWKLYGKGHWRKLKGIATVEFLDGTIAHAESPLVRSPQDRRERLQNQTGH
jgi:hypothetical protein